MIRLSNIGAVSDIREVLKLREATMSLSDLRSNLEGEKKYAKRASVIKLFEAAIKRKEKLIKSMWWAKGKSKKLK